MARKATATPAPQPHLEYERRFLAQGALRIAGVDEVGRGSLAGPIVAAAVVLPLLNRRVVSDLNGVADSKELTPGARDELFTIIRGCATSIGLGWASHHTVDRAGVARANSLALTRAVRRLSPTPDVVLVDYFRLPECPLPQENITRGDSLSLSIACASIIAKVIRDRWMIRWEKLVPGYDFAGNKGYGTARHRRALEERGPSRIHRMSFRPMAQRPG